MGCLKIFQSGNLFVKEPLHQPAHYIPEGNLKRHFQDRDCVLSGKLDQILYFVLRPFYRFPSFQDQSADLFLHQLIDIVFKILHRAGPEGIESR